MPINISTQTKVTTVINHTTGASGTADINGAIIDMQGFESCTFIVTFGTIEATAVTSVKAQQDSASNMAAAADLLGTSITVASDDDNKSVVLEIIRPRERYVRVVVDRGTDDAECTAVAIQAGAKTEPTTHAGTVIGAEAHLSPAEGTA